MLLHAHADLEVGSDHINTDTTPRESKTNDRVHWQLHAATGSTRKHGRGLWHGPPVTSMGTLKAFMKRTASA